MEENQHMVDHQIIINSQVYKLIPLGFCACGCGKKTNVAYKNDIKRNNIKGRHFKFKKGHNLRVSKKADLHPMWNGGTTNSHGYRKIYKPGHHRSDTHGYVLEHILIAERALGKTLPIGSQIHHHDGKNNKYGLVICQNQKYHALLHQRTKALKACGHANWLKCWVCQIYDDPCNLVNNKSKQTPCHRHCRNEDQKNRRNNYAE